MCECVVIDESIDENASTKVKSTFGTGNVLKINF